MTMPDELLALITQLQQDMTVSGGRRQLLEYARVSSGARLALLFLLDKTHHQLVFLEKRGKHGHSRSMFAPDSGDLLDTRHIPLGGLFGAALSQHGGISIVDAAACAQCLVEERYWLGASPLVLFSPIGFERQRGGAQHGLLVLCFNQQDDGEIEALKDNARLLISIALLAAYLPETHARARKRTSSTPAKQVGGPRLPSVPAGRKRRGTGATAHKTSTGRLRGQGRTAPALSAQPIDERELQETIEQERGRIARDIHDGAAQQIGLVLLKLEYVQRVFATQPDIALRELRRSREILEGGLQELRYVLSSLATRWEEEGFESALRALIDDLALNEPHLNIVSDIQNLDLIPPLLQTPVYHFVQEALNNTRKHARAELVIVRLQVRPGLLFVEVSDNGVGFSTDQTVGSRRVPGAGVSHLGLRSMRERVQQAGGKWEMRSIPGEGVTVKARFPLSITNSTLTKREREVLRLLIQGLTNRAIAEKLSVSTETVKSHVHHIMQKLHVTDRTQAAVLASKGQWV